MVKDTAFPYQSFFFWLLNLLALPVSAQPKLTDSLQRQLALASVDTNRVLLLSELCLQYRLSEPDSAMHYGQKALQLARQTNFRRGEVNALGSIGFVMREVGNLPNALKTEFKAYQMAANQGFTYDMARCLNIIGNIYRDLNDYPKALQYYQQSRQNHRQIQNRIGIAITESNIGSTYELMNQLDSAWHYEQRAYQQMVQLKLVNNLPYVLRILGNIQDKRGNVGQAMHFYEQSEQTALRENNLRNVAFVRTEMARLYRKKNQLDSCLLYARQGLSDGQKGSYKREILAAATLLADVYRPISPDEALRYYDIAAKARDELYGAERLQAIQTITFDEQERQYEMQVAQIAYQNRIRQFSLGIGLLVLLLITLILWRNNLQQQQKNGLLALQKAKISQQSSQLTVMMQELHHRVKNNFAIVSSLLQIQSSRLSDNMALQAIRASLERVEAMSLIHQRLYQSSQVTKVNMEQFLIDLVLSLMQAYGHRDDNFDLRIDVKHPLIDVDTAMPLGLIANELITNAFKYAFTATQTPMLRVSLTQDTAGVTVEIQDNGPGIDPAVWHDTRQTSFGKRLINLLAQQLEGYVELQNQQGALFRLYVPAQTN